MKSMPIIRRLDGGGRIVLPEVFRAQLGIEEGTEMEVYPNGDTIVLAKYARGCIFCGITEGTVAYQGQLICRNCIAERPVYCSEEHLRGGVA